MSRILRWLMAGLVLMVLSGCGGGGNLPVDDFSVFKTYAQNGGTGTTPTVQDYMDAGVTGVTEANLNDVNEAVAGLDPDSVDSEEELQNIADRFGLNTIPSANAGDDKAITEGSTATLTCSGSDADGDTLSYRWLDGTVELAKSATYITLANLSVGEHTYTCEVSDGADKATDSVKITVSAKTNTPPTADAGNNQTITEGNMATLTCEGADADGDTLIYRWLDSMTELVKSATYTTPSNLSVGEHTYTCEVSDGTDRATDDVKVTVGAKPNVAPVADISATPTVATYGTIISFDASSSSDSDGSISSYKWSEGATTLSAVINFTKDDLSIGTHTITLTVADDDGATSSVTVQIVIQANTQLKKTGQTKSYDENGNEVIDGNIKDDGYYQTGVTPNYSRDNAGNIVTDHITGLMWQDDEYVKNIRRNWVDANIYCSNLSLGNYHDWRIPTIDELMGIVDVSRWKPAINTIYFHNTLYIMQNISSTTYYWSSTAVYGDDTYIRGVSFQYGFDYWIYKNTGSYYLRCVR